MHCVALLLLQRAVGWWRRAIQTYLRAPVRTRRALFQIAALKIKIKLYEKLRLLYGSVLAFVSYCIDL